MFCETCGSQLPDRANFCVGCGAKVQAAHPVAQAAAPPAYAPPAHHPPAEPRTVPVTNYAGTAAPVAAPHAPAKCNWCGAEIQAGQQNCPMCGAASNLPSRSTNSGWAKLPGRKDMAKLNFGKSVCQIEGLYSPVADMNLAPEDSIYFTHHVLLWKDPQVVMSTMSMKGAWKRLRAGLPLVMMQAQGPGHIALSEDSSGELIALPLHPGQSIDVREHLFLAATNNVHYDWFQTNISYRTRRGDESEIHYPLGQVMDRFGAAQNPGLLLLHAAGNVFVRELHARQTILVKPTALIFKDPSVRMTLHYDQPSVGFSAWYANQTYLWLRLYGPGRIAVQSVFERLEGESNITGVPRNQMVNVDIGDQIVGSLLKNLFDK
jgi:uncharacterized protein (AIM24 family)